MNPYFFPVKHILKSSHFKLYEQILDKTAESSNRSASFSSVRRKNADLLTCRSEADTGVRKLVI